MKECEHTIVFLKNKSKTDHVFGISFNVL